MIRPRHQADCRDRHPQQAERVVHETGVSHEQGGDAAPNRAEGSSAPSRVRDVRRHAGLSRFDAEEPGGREGYSATGWRFGSDSGPDDWSYSESGAIDRGRGQRVGPHGYAEPRSRDHRRADERIREEVSDRLGDDHSVDASGISVDVQKGGVTLSGTVTSRDQKRRAGDIADCISGVKEVTNNIRVSCDDPHQSRTSGAGHQEPARSSSRIGTGGGSRPAVGDGSR